MTDQWQLKLKKLILIIIVTVHEVHVKENVENKGIYSFVAEKMFSKKLLYYQFLDKDTDHLKYDSNSQC